MKIGLIQMPVTSEKEKNLSYARQSIDECTRQGADLVILPEMFMCPYTNEAFLVYAEQAGEQTWRMLSDAARNNGIVLVGGSMPERDENKIFNTSFVFDPVGDEIARHRKIHLFDIDVKGGQRFKESDVFSYHTKEAFVFIHINQHTAFKAEPSCSYSIAIFSFTRQGEKITYKNPHFTISYFSGKYSVRPPTFFS